MRKNNKGFTLIEMLIVVAIIAILVAVSIPLVQNSLERTRVATDAANERAAKAEAIILYLNNQWVETNKYYDATSGSFKSEAPSTGYGKCKTHKGSYIEITLDENTGEVKEVKWVGGTGTGAPHNSTVTD